MADIIKLTKQNFFNERSKEAPVAMALFSKEVDNFKAKVGWEDFFKGSYVSAEGKVMEGIKFHDLPFALQNGFLDTFFVAQGIHVMAFPSADGKGFSWDVIDTIAGAMAKSFLDSTQTDITVFMSWVSCKIDAYRSAFLLLEERISNEGTTEADKTLLN